MIRSRAEKPNQHKIEIDLNGPDGNAFALMKYAQILGRQVGYSEKRITAIRKVMMMSDYDGLVNVFDNAFGDHVILWRQAMSEAALVEFQLQGLQDVFVIVSVAILSILITAWFFKD